MLVFFLIKHHFNSFRHIPHPPSLSYYCQRHTDTQINIVMFYISPFYSFLVRLVLRCWWKKYGKLFLISCMCRIHASSLCCSFFPFLPGTQLHFSRLQDWLGFLFQMQHQDGHASTSLEYLWGKDCESPWDTFYPRFMCEFSQHCLLLLIPWDINC